MQKRLKRIKRESTIKEKIENRTDLLALSKSKENTLPIFDNEEKRYRWSLDQMMRYTPVIRFIKKLNLKDPLIIETGAGVDGGLATYTNEELSVKAIDLITNAAFSLFRMNKSKAFEPIVGDVNNMPIRNNSADIVVS